MALTGRAAVVALIGTLAALAFRSAWAVLGVDGLIAGGIAADCVLAGGVRQLRATRSGDTRILLGQPGAVTLTIGNPGRRALRGVVRDAWPPSAGAAPDRAAVLIPGGGQATLTTTLVPQRRGDRPAGRVTVRSLGPLGLAGRQASLTVPWSVRVLPPFLSRRHLPEKLAQLRQLDGQHRSLVRGPGTEFDSLREYVAGDDVRSIDWRSSARRAEVMVRTWRPERDRRIIIVLDTGRTSAGRVAGLPRLDTSMDAALLLAALAVRAGDRVDLLAVDRQLRARVVGAGRGEVLAALTSAMAVLEAELTESDYGVMASAVLATARQRCLVVLLTDLSPAALTAGLLPRIGLLSARYRLLIGAVSDPRVAQLAAGRGDAEAVYAAGAAARAQADRARISALLRRRGVEIVDAPPDRLPPALADAYLRLKAAGQL
ncbi:MAG TPA: DUF58 domain-containing protein [Streptosporangiaceae bacterium]|nr:DUF58 domain-containing protein [Streptosporangiaceae bacterium]